MMGFDTYFGLWKSESEKRKDFKMKNVDSIVQELIDKAEKLRRKGDYSYYELELSGFCTGKYILHFKLPSINNTIFLIGMGKSTLCEAVKDMEARIDQKLKEIEQQYCPHCGKKLDC